MRGLRVRFPLCAARAVRGGGLACGAATVRLGGRAGASARSARLSQHVARGSASTVLSWAPEAAPVVTVHSAAALIGRSEEAVNEAIPRLIGAGVLQQTTVGRRNRTFEARDLIDAFSELERQLASR